jgi:hypothetical protein
MLARRDLLAGVFVGGMEGIFEEYELVAAREALAIVPIGAPGGASRRLRPSPEIAERLRDELASARYPALALDLVEILAERAAR